ncbi:MAG TPA: Asp-tRNA(Asn)/Glu-tRNA(Gln) amidotransferase subunit GatB, partial [Vicinamibacteria bacterium]
MATATAKFEEIVARYEPVIGLEVHCQLLTRTKLFCACANEFGGEPNTKVCPVCLGLPGSLPVLSRHAVTLAIRAALATECTVEPRSVFARKNYFYPDLPKGYQISQYDQPLARGGHIEIPAGGGFRRIRLNRIHMEEDAGKLLHEGFSWSAEKSGVDFNRGGVPLIEIVTEPDLHTAEEAHDYLTALKAVLLYAGVSDCNMEEGSLRCDANVSVRKRGALALGTRAEIKNLNSFRNVARAI